MSGIIIITLSALLFLKSKKQKAVGSIRTFGGNSGYSGYSKSRRAIAAEKRGLRNKSQMNKEFADEVNAILQEWGDDRKVTLKQIKQNIQYVKPQEWHHTSSYGNQTDYYSAESVASFFHKKKEKDNTLNYDLSPFEIDSILIRMNVPAEKREHFRKRLEYYSSNPDRTYQAEANKIYNQIKSAEYGETAPFSAEEYRQLKDRESSLRQMQILADEEYKRGNKSIYNSIIDEINDYINI